MVFGVINNRSPPIVHVYIYLNRCLGVKLIKKTIKIKMKHLLLALAIGFIAMGCRNFEKGESINSDFTGTWKYSAYYDAMFGWRNISEGYTFTFKKDSTFTSTKYESCQYGTYHIKGDTLTLNFACSGFKAPLVEKIRREGTSLILTPTYLFCDEGCSYRFIKISNQ